MNPIGPQYPALLLAVLACLVGPACASIAVDPPPTVGAAIAQVGDACLTSFDCAAGDYCGGGGACVAGGTALLAPTAAAASSAAPAVNETQARAYFERLKAEAGTVLVETDAGLRAKRSLFAACAAQGAEPGSECRALLDTTVDGFRAVLAARAAWEGAAGNGVRTSRNSMATAMPATTTGIVTALCRPARAAETTSAAVRAGKIDDIMLALEGVSPWLPNPGGATYGTVGPHYPTGAFVVVRNGQRMGMVLNPATGRKALQTVGAIDVSDGRHFYLDLDADIGDAIDAVVNDAGGCRLSDRYARGKLLGIAGAADLESRALLEHVAGIYLAAPILDVTSLGDLIATGSWSLAEGAPGAVTAVSKLTTIVTAIDTQLAGIAEATNRVAAMQYDSGLSLTNHTRVNTLRAMTVVRSRVLGANPGFEDVDRALEAATDWNQILDTALGALRLGVLAATGIAALLGVMPAVPVGISLAATVGAVGALAILPLSVAQTLRNGAALGANDAYRAGRLIDGAAFEATEAGFRRSVLLLSLDTLAAVSGLKWLRARAPVVDAQAWGVSSAPPPYSSGIASADDIAEGTVVRGYLAVEKNESRLIGVMPPDEIIATRHAGTLVRAAKNMRDVAYIDAQGAVRLMPVADIPISGINDETLRAVAEIAYFSKTEVGIVVDGQGQLMMRMAGPTGVPWMQGETLLVHVQLSGNPYPSIAAVRRGGAFRLAGSAGDVNTAIQSGLEEIDILQVVNTPAGVESRLVSFSVPLQMPMVITEISGFPSRLISAAVIPDW